MPTSNISWTDDALNFLTWNCDKVSPGCKHCYAEAHSEKYPQNSALGLFRGAPKLREKAWEELRLTKSGKTVFINTHSDTFHPGVSLEWLKRMFTVMNQRSDLIFLLLTKRPETARFYAPYLYWGDHIWLGTSIETQAYYAPRLGALLDTPARHRFISFEPLLGEIKPDANLRLVNWIIAGGESGEERRPFGRQWAGDLQEFAACNSIPFYFKQGSSIYPDQDRELNGKTYSELPPEFEALRAQYRVNAQQDRLF